jgi:hypothetical protein
MRGATRNHSGFVLVNLPVRAEIDQAFVICASDRATS